MRILRSVSLLVLLVSLAENRALAQKTPAILSQSSDRIAALGADLELRVDAGGDPSLKFQWRLNGEAIPGATGPVLRLAGLKGADGGAFSVLIYNDEGAIESRVMNVETTVSSLPFADTYASRGEITGSSGSGSGSTIGATKEAKDPRIFDKRGGGTIWVSWKAPASGQATFTTDGSNFDTLLGVYKEGKGGHLAEETSDDDAGGYATSSVTFNAQAGTQYEIAVSGTGSAEGRVVLNWDLTVREKPYLQVYRHPRSQTLGPGQSLNLSVDYLGLTENLLDLSIVDRLLKAALGKVSVQWFRDEQPLPGENRAELRINNFKKEMVGRYSARLTAGDQTVWSQAAEIQFSSEGLATLGARNKLVEASEVGLRLGAARQSLAALMQNRPQLNRNASKHSYISGTSGTFYFTSSTGHDPGEPNHCGIVGGSSYWFVYEPSSTGQMTMNTDGSSYNTILAVYRDTFCCSGYDSLASVTCDNNSGADGLDSAVSFTANYGDVYYIVVDGVSGATGSATLNYSFNTAPTISTISNQTISEDGSTSAIGFTISDAQTSASSLQVTASSSNSTLAPQVGISCGGSSSSRTVTVTPAANQNGSCTITVTVTDGGGMQATRQFNLTVNAVNDNPVAAADYGYRYPYQQIYYYVPTVLGNDYDVDGQNPSITSVSYYSAQGGTAVLSGSYITYTPPMGYNGTDSFTYTISDGVGGTANGTIYACMYY